MALKKYNPGFLSDDEIVASFCVRSAELESLLEPLSEPGSNSSGHSLVIGPRGSGKTHLLRRVAAEVRRDPALAGLFPVVFAEESYEVTTCGEFWLECLTHLAEQAPDEERDGLLRSLAEIRTVPDDFTLSERCLGSLLDFSVRQERRLLLLVENLNMLFTDMIDADAGWRLRKTLQTEPRIVLLGSATSRFDEIDDPDHAMFDLFRIITLQPLSTEECGHLWRTIAPGTTAPQTVRALEILTGGNARLLAILAQFGSGQSFARLMENLLDLVDDHTEYFKSHLESLPPLERRVYLALARLWKPATTREVAEQARIDTNRASAQLARLVQKGVVAIAGGTSRQRQYYVNERLYNIYYLLRRGGGSDRVVEALVDFMIAFYSPSGVAELLEGSLSDVSRYDSAGREWASRLSAALLERFRSRTEDDAAAHLVAALEDLLEPETTFGSPSVDAQAVIQLLGMSMQLAASANNIKAAQLAQLLEQILEQQGETADSVNGVDASALQLLMACQHHLRGDGQAADAAFQRAVDEAQANRMGSLAELASVLRGASLFEAGRVAEALVLAEAAVARYRDPDSREPTHPLILAIDLKDAVLKTDHQPMAAEDISLLLRYIVAIGRMTSVAYRILARFAASGDPSSTLDLIAAEQASDVVRPLVVALQMEAGDTPRVAKEVEEVAADVRSELQQIRAERRHEARR